MAPLNAVAGETFSNCYTGVSHPVLSGISVELNCRRERARWWDSRGKARPGPVGVERFALHGREGW